MFRNAAAPEVSEFDGDYLVDMLTITPSLKIFSHTKSFWTSPSGVEGTNVLFGGWRWGRIRLERGPCRNFDPLDSVIISYDLPDNSFLTKGWCDFVRRTGEDSYLGRYNVKIGRSTVFLGYFSLEKKRS